MCRNLCRQIQINIAYHKVTHWQRAVGFVCAHSAPGLKSKIRKRACCRDLTRSPHQEQQHNSTKQEEEEEEEEGCDEKQWNETGNQFHESEQPLIGEALSPSAGPSAGQQSARRGETLGGGQRLCHNDTVLCQKGQRPKCVLSEWHEWQSTHANSQQTRMLWQLVLLKSSSREMYKSSFKTFKCVFTNTARTTL